MPTSTEVVRERREAEAWEERMRAIRAAEAAKAAQPAPEAATAPLLGPDGQPITPEPSDG